MSYRLSMADVSQPLPLADESVQCVVTSPPYWGLRDYGLQPSVWGGDSDCDHIWGEEAARKVGKVTHGTGQSTLTGGHESWGNRDGGTQGAFCQLCGAWRGCFGLEPTVGLYVDHLVEVFREVRRVLRSDGTLWLNLGDSFASGKGTCHNPGGGGMSLGQNRKAAGAHPLDRGNVSTLRDSGLKPKDLVGIPWRVALALQADGWWLRSDIIWCLSGGTWLYARTQKGDGPMMIRDVARLDPATVKLWDGTRWAQVLGWTRSARKGDELQFTLRSGERISCTPTHKFPTERGLVSASELRIGDVLQRVRLPEPAEPRDCAIDQDAAWLAGLYIADGSMSGSTIQISSNAGQEERWRRVSAIARKFGGSATRTIDENKMEIRVYGKVLFALLDELVSGHDAYDKGFSPRVWRYSNAFVRSMLDGYLSGDGYWDEKNRRWRLHFCRNVKLERDLRTACARLGLHLVLRKGQASFDGRQFPSFRGEIRLLRSGHQNEKKSAEVVAISKARCRYVYDVGVDGDPHLFCLASGILTHNSKPNAMPESVKDRPTKAHEYLFLLAKSRRYFYDADAIREPSKYPDDNRKARAKESHKRMPNESVSGVRPGSKLYPMRNKRTVWSVATAPFKGAHFATFPPALIEPCILAGTSARGACPECGAPWRRVTSVGWEPTCTCGLGETRPCVVFDPFTGSGTTGAVATKHGRDFVGLDLNAEYLAMAQERIGQAAREPYLL